LSIPDPAQGPEPEAPPAPDARATRALRGVARVVLTTVVGGAVALLAGVVVPRVLGPDAYGQLTFLAATFSIAAPMAGLGTGTVIFRQFAPLYDAGKFEQAAGLYKAILTVRALAVPVFAIGACVFLALANPFSPMPLTLVLVGLLIVAGTLTESLFVLQAGAQRPGTWGLWPLFRSLRQICFVPAGFLLAGLPGAVGGLLVGELVIGAVGLRLARGIVSLRATTADFGLLGTHAGLAARAWANQMLMLLAGMLGPVLVGLGTGEARETGFYGLALTFTMLGFNTAQRGVMSLTPVLSVFHEQGNRSRATLWAGMAVRGAILASVLLWGVCLLWGRPLIVLVLGEAFAPIWPLLAVLLAVLPFRCYTSVVHQACVLHGRPDLSIVPSLIRLTVFVGPGIWAMGRWGGVGLAGAYVISFAVGNVVAYVVVWRVLGVRISAARSALLLLGALPFAGVWLATPHVSAIAGAPLAAAAAILLAHVTRAFRFGDWATLYRAARGTPPQAARDEP